MTKRRAKDTAVAAARWFLFFFILATTPATCSDSETDLRALLAFKENLLDSKGALDSWTPNGTLQYCSWEGIACGSKHKSRVVSIILNSQGLAGSLSPHLGNLSFLRWIDLQNNSFSGPIPQELGYLRRLVHIEFSNNSLQGEIPQNLSQCKNLLYLNLIDNNLVGNIPSELGSLVKLTDLGLMKNNLQGTIPSSLGNLTSLIQLSLSENRLHGEIPESLVNLGKLRLLSMRMNQLSGLVPPGLYNISSIRQFSIFSNQLHGNIPYNIGTTLPNMRFLGLADNYFTGVLPVSLSNATYLKFVGLYSCSFTGPMLKNLDRLLDLYFLSVCSNNIGDDISFVSSLTNCTNLTVLEICSNSFTGSLPNTIGNLSSQLRLINLEDNQFHGNIPSDVGNLVGLSTISLSYNRFNGPIPSSIGKLSKLQRLFLSGNRFTNEIPSSVGNLTFLNNLVVKRNNILGSIPINLVNCSNMLALDLSSNKLTGPIPRELMSLSSLSIVLNLSQNLLYGSIPDEVGQLRNLGHMDLSNNRLSGPVPSTIKQCISLEGLNLGGNSFHGNIPPSLSVLSALRYLDLSINNFSGSIPSFLEELQLTYLNLSFNRLEGRVPLGGVFRNQSAISIEGNLKLCGGISELKLSHCSSAAKKNSLSTLLKILIPTALIAFATIVCVCWYVLKRLKTKPSENLGASSSFKSQFQRLSYADLRQATSGFSETNMIGSGRFGSVYKGILNEGETLVAIKVLNLNVKGAFKSFMAECNALRGARHRNLVKLLSICVGADFQGNDFTALLYQFKAKGSLEQWLHQKPDEQDGSIANARYLTLMQRLNIAIDIASALEYLHNGTESAIVHGDLKPSNVLLDDHMIAYVGDFGLARVLSNVPDSFPSGESNNSSIAVKGTIGYIPPEYGMGGTSLTQGDVYSYGILLLEIFTNTRPTSNIFNGDSNLHHFVSSKLPYCVMEILDPLVLQKESHRFSDSVRDTMTSILGVGVACSRELPRERIPIADVVVQLQTIRSTWLKQGLSY